jgi:hypothetical protein
MDYSVATPSQSQLSSHTDKQRASLSRGILSFNPLVETLLARRHSSHTENIPWKQFSPVFAWTPALPPDRWRAEPQLSNGSFLSNWRMVSSGLLRRVALVRTEVSEDPGASFIRVTKIGALGTTQAATSNRRPLRSSQRTSVASCSLCCS